MKTDINNDFLVYVIEEYKYLEDKPANEVIELFTEHNVFNYILRHYVVLHTMSGRAIVDDINLYVNQKNNEINNRIV